MSDLSQQDTFDPVQEKIGQKKHIKRLILFFCGLPIAFLIAALAVWLFFDVSYSVPPALQVREEEFLAPAGHPNGLQDLLTVLSEDRVTEFYSTRSRLDQFNPEFEKTIRAQVARHEASLAAFTSICARPESELWFWPDPRRPPEVPDAVPAIQIQSLSLLVQHHAWLLVGNGKHSEALESLTSLARFGQRLQNTPCTLVDQLVSLSLQRNALERIHHLATSSTFNDGELLSLQQTLSDLDPRPKNVALGVKMHHSLMSTDPPSKNRPEILQNHLDSSVLASLCDLLYKPGLTRRVDAQNHLELLSALDQNWHTAAQKCAELSALPPQGKRWISINPVGDAFNAHRARGLESVMKRFLSWQIQIRITVVQIALRRFELHHQRLPNSLTELVPTYLDAVPRDPLTTKPLLWNPSSQVVYSCGLNGLNDAGRFQKELQLNERDFGQRYWWEPLPPQPRRR